MLGVHVNKTSSVLDNKGTADDLSEAIIRDTTELKINAAQIFTFGPRFMNPNKIDFPAVMSATWNVDLSVHSAYASVGIWKIDTQDCQSSNSKKQIDNIKMQLISCQKANAWGLVLHITKVFPDVAARVMKVLKPTVKKSKICLLLEMVSNKADPDKTYETPEKIDNLTTLIGAEDWWGWCVDTAHLWGAGFDCSSYEAMHSWLEALTYKDRIKMFHLNGSSAIKGSGADKHEIAFGPDDKIWNGIDPNESGVRAIVEFAYKRNIPLICEINRGSEKNVRISISRIKKLFKLQTAE